mmetsp:Transcript_7105/g.11208  ORF Transcript_7105/g.11208 Transcript_7105/m.11208 type:complete len:411 (+) Transcript_7105:96-1328(+)
MNDAESLSTGKALETNGDSQTDNIDSKPKVKCRRGRPSEVAALLYGRCSGATNQDVSQFVNIIDSMRPLRRRDKKSSMVLSALAQHDNGNDSDEDGGAWEASHDNLDMPADPPPHSASQRHKKRKSNSEESDAIICQESNGDGKANGKGRGGRYSLRSTPKLGLVSPSALHSLSTTSSARGASIPKPPVQSPSPVPSQMLSSSHPSNGKAKISSPSPTKWLQDGVDVNMIGDHLFVPEPNSIITSDALQHAKYCLEHCPPTTLLFKLERFEDAVKGVGVKAGEDILAGQYVCEYSGELITEKEAQRREVEDYQCQTHCYMYFFACGTKRWCIDSTSCPEEVHGIGRLINHNINGNLLPRMIIINKVPRIALFTARNISRNEELTYDYGDRSNTRRVPWLVGLPAQFRRTS